MTVKDYSELTWNEIREEAKRRGLHAQQKREHLEILLRAQDEEMGSQSQNGSAAPVDSAPEPEPSVDVNRAAELIEELKKLGVDISQTQSPPASQTSTGSYGPNYWQMGLNQLRSEAVGKGIVAQGNLAQRENLIQAMQDYDKTQGYMPFPKPAAVQPVMSGIRIGETPVHTNQRTRDATEIVDQNGTVIALVYRKHGKEPDHVTLDMQYNAELIERLINEHIGGFGQ